MPLPRGWILACAVAAGAAATLAQPARAPAGTAPSGGLYVTTLPSGADVYVDGTYVGRSPVLVDALGAGKHDVSMTKAGWALREAAVDVPAGSIALSTTRLTAADAGGGSSGSFVVRGVPDRASVSVDGNALTSRGPVSAGAGPHQLTVDTGHGRTTRGFIVIADTVTEVLLHDSAPGDAHAAAVVAAVEEWLPDAAVALSGKKLVLRYGGHTLVAHLGEATVRLDGQTIEYDSGPETIGGKLYLPLALLERLSGDEGRASPRKVK